MDKQNHKNNIKLTHHVKEMSVKYYIKFGEMNLTIINLVKIKSL